MSTRKVKHEVPAIFSFSCYHTPNHKIYNSISNFKRKAYAELCESSSGDSKNEKKGELKNINEKLTSALRLLTKYLIFAV